MYNLTGFIVALAAVLSWDLSPLCWIFVVIYLFFTIGFGYFLLIKPAARSSDISGEKA